MITPFVLDNIISYFYLFLWVGTFAYYHYRRFTFDAGSVILATYITYAIISIISINDTAFIFTYTYDHLRFWPYVYLYMMMMVALAPTLRIHSLEMTETPIGNTRVLKWMSIMIIVCALLLVPKIVSNFSDGIVKLFTDTEAGKDAYEEQLNNAEDAGSAISNIPAIIYNAFADIAVFMAFYYLTCKKRNIWIVSGLFFSVAIGLMLPIMSGQRSGIILCLLTLILAFFLFKAFMSKRLLRYARVLGVTILVAVLLPVAAITFSRYEKMQDAIGSYLCWYIGQGNIYFNNHAMEVKEIRHGERTANLICRLFDSEHTPKNFIERRSKYFKNSIDDDVFSTFVGDFCIDYGPGLTVVIFLLFNGWVIIAIRPKDGKLTFDQLLLVYFTGCICMQGGMYLFAYSDTGNLKIITIGTLYAYVRYHDILLKRFPKKFRSLSVSEKIAKSTEESKKNN